MLIPSLAELAAMLIILLICQLYSSQIPPKAIQKKTLHYCTIINHHTSTLQHNTYAHTYHKFIKDGTRRISYFSTSPTSISHPTLLDHYCTYLALGNLECHWKTFNRQFDRTQQLLQSLEQYPSAPTQLLSTLQLELSNIKDIYNSGKTTITSVIKLLQSNQPQTHIHCRRSLLPFLGDALSWLTGTATTKDIHSIKTRINQLITTQASQCNTLAHIISILNITRYATQVNRCGINTLMDAVRATSHDINNLYNLTTSLATSINFHQMILHIRSVFANLCDSLNYIQMVSTHTMDYIDAATSGTLSPHVLPVLDLQRMLQHIADTLPPMLHLPISPEDTLHFYRYLHTHVLIENKQFLLLIDVPIQDRSRQITIHQILTLNIPQGNYSACYDVDTKYFGVTKDATMAVELSTTQFQACQEANGQFCSITTPFSTISKPTILYSSFIYKEHCGYHCKMLIASMQSLSYYSTYPNSTRCLDPHYTSYSTSEHLDINMS